MKYLKYKMLVLLTIGLLCHSQKINCQNETIIDQVTHNSATNNEVKIHYVSLGKGPLLLFVHGFPDYWYTWREQMKVLSQTHQVVAVDLRGYNLSDAPSGVENYTYNFLMNDLKAVIDHTGNSSAQIVAHDWGAAIAWQFASHYPQYVKKLVILSIGHPKAGAHISPIDTKNRNPSYAEYFVTDKFYNEFDENWFSSWVKDKSVKELYKKAFRKSNKDAMLNYYKANFPLKKNLSDSTFLARRKQKLPNVRAEVLIIHGKKDSYAPTKGHNNTWDYTNNELTLVVLPSAGHFIQRDASDRVTHLIQDFISN